MDTADDRLHARPNPLAKVAMLLGGLFALACGLFCIGATILDRSFYRTHHTQDAVEVGAIGGRVLELTVPEILRPNRAIENESFGTLTRAAVWRSPAGSVLVVVQLPRPFDAKTAVDVRAELMQMPHVIRPEEVYQHHYYGARTSSNEKVKINGVEIEFVVEESGLVASGIGTTPTSSLLGPFTVTATFPTKDGLTGLFLINVLNSDPTKEQVLEMIRNAK